MTKQEVLNTILNSGVIPIVRTDTASHAQHAVEAIRIAGLPLVEVTMTVPGAIKILETACDRFGDSLIVGAGTVLDAATARQCMLAGAEFFVTPSLDLPTIEICNRYSKCVIPGALTPTEIMTAWNAGATMVKVFPVGVLGGARYIKAVKAPLPQVLLVPTGGGQHPQRPVVLRSGSERRGGRLGAREQALAPESRLRAHHIGGEGLSGRCGRIPRRLSRPGWAARSCHASDPTPRVVLIRLRSLGDTVLATPAFALLRRAVPDARIHVAMEDRFAGPPGPSSGSRQRPAHPPPLRPGGEGATASGHPGQAPEPLHRHARRAPRRPG